MYYIIFAVFFLIGLYHLFTIISAKRKAIKALIENGNKVLGDVQSSKDSTVDLTFEQFMSIKNNLETIVTPNLNSQEIKVFDSSINSGTTYSQLKTINEMLNQSGTTSNVIFTTPNLNREERRKLSRQQNKKKK